MESEYYVAFIFRIQKKNNFKFQSLFFHQGHESFLASKYIDKAYCIPDLLSKNKRKYIRTVSTIIEYRSYKMYEFVGLDIYICIYKYSLYFPSIRVYKYNCFVSTCMT